MTPLARAVGAAEGLGFADLEAGLGHALAEAAIFEEVLFEAKILSIEEIGCDLDKSNDDVGTDGGIIISIPFLNVA